MFSGFGISADGTNFAMALRAGLYFRADEVTIPQYEAEGSKPFQYSTRAKTVTVNSYWQLPARLFDDTEELSAWARAALAAAQRAAVKKRPKARKAGEEDCCNEKGRTQKGCGQKDGCQEGEAEALGHLAAAALASSAVYSGSTSQITRLRPLRLAA